MNETIRLKEKALIFSIPLLIFSLAIFLSLGGYLSDNPELVVALVVDLMVTAPFLYFLLIRKKNIPRVSVFSVFLIGTIIVSFVLPHNIVPELSYVKDIILPLLEIGVFSMVAYKAYQIKNKFDSNNEDAWGAIHLAVKETIGDNLPAKLLASEIGFLYYGLWHWKKVEVKENEFTYHQKNGLPTVLGALVLILLVEAFAVHILLAQWSVTAAWILTIASLYATFQIVAHIKSCTKRYVDLGEGGIKIKYGLFGDGGINFENIQNIELYKKEPKNKKDIIKLALVEMLETHNIKIDLKNEITLTGAYGLKKKGTTILMHIDEKEKFVEKINEVLGKNNPIHSLLP